MTRRAPLMAGGVALVVTALVVLFAFSDPGGSTATSPLVGRMAPDVDATDTTGRKFRIDDYRGTWLLVNFFATWCPPCRIEHPELVAFAERHAAAKDASVVSVAFNEDPKVVEKYFAENGGDWPVIAEGNGRLALEYGVVKLPESFLVGPDGRIVAKFIGGVKAADIERVIERARRPS